MMRGCSMSSQIFVKAEGNGLAMYIGRRLEIKIELEHVNPEIEYVQNKD